MHVVTGSLSTARREVDPGLSSHATERCTTPGLDVEDLAVSGRHSWRSRVETLDVRP